MDLELILDIVELKKKENGLKENLYDGIKARLVYLFYEFHNYLLY
jgi:hypothetical protein